MADNIIEKEKITGQVERQRVGDEFPTVESPRKSENVEAMSWMEKLERRFGRTQPQTNNDVQDDAKAQPAPQAQSTQPPVTIPITASQMQSTAKPDPEIALSWLVIWAKRQIAQLMKQNRKVLFAPEPVEDTKK